MTNEVELEPCPFCGGKAEVMECTEPDNLGGRCVVCTSCLASSAVRFPEKGGEEPTEAWNTRAQSEDKADAERYRFLRDQSDADEQQPYIAKEQLNSWGQWLTLALTPAEADEAIDAARTKEKTT